MRKILFLFTLLFSAVLNFVDAQAPQKMSYQIVVRDSIGALITNTNVGFKISIVKDSANGAISYSETQNIATNNNGLASLEIGSGIVLTGSFPAISWGSGAHFIKTEIDPFGGANYSMSGVSQLLSVPYALFAANTTKGTLPTVTTNNATASINSNTTANVTCNLVNNGGEFVLAKGVCFSTTINPTLNNGYETVTTGTGSSSSTGAYTVLLTNLNPNTNYYLKAFATTINGTSYGNQISVLTNQFLLPVLDSVHISSITRTTAVANCNISNDGGSAVTTRGFCYSTTANPTIANSKKTSGSGIGSFLASISSLVAGTTYYLKAYATNNVGTSYSNEIVFTTLPLTKPTILTQSVTEMTATAATINCKITDYGGNTAIIEKGVCYSKTPNPTIASFKVISNALEDTFKIYFDTLDYNTTYYVRAYATNAIGIGYGNELSFTTDSLRIGSRYKGGYVGYILQPGDTGYIVGQNHGLIAGYYNVSYTNWNCTQSSIITDTSLGSGKQNTLNINAACTGITTPASLCTNLVLKGYNDWYLPSINELYKLYTTKSAFEARLGVSFWKYGNYWSSSIIHNSSGGVDYVICRDFFNNPSTNNPMNGSPLYYVPIRSF